MPRQIQDEFSLPEKQGARIKRFLAEKKVTLTSEQIGKIIGKEASAVRKRLEDKYHWKPEEVRLIAEHIGVSFNRLFIPLAPLVRPRRATPNKVREATLNELINEPRLLRVLFGISFDSKSRDVVVRHLLRLDRYVKENANTIRKRRQRERDRRLDEILDRHVMKWLSQEFGGMRFIHERKQLPQHLEDEYVRKWNSLRHDSVVMSQIIYARKKPK